MKRRFDLARIGEHAFDVATVVALLSVFGFIWATTIVWVQLFLTAAVIAVVLGFLLSRPTPASRRGIPGPRYVETARRDTIHPPVGETDESDDRWAGVDLTEAMDRAEAEEAERQEAHQAVT